MNTFNILAEHEMLSAVCEATKTVFVTFITGS